MADPRKILSNEIMSIIYWTYKRQDDRPDLKEPRVLPFRTMDPDTDEIFADVARRGWRQAVEEFNNEDPEHRPIPEDRGKVWIAASRQWMHRGYRWATKQYAQKDKYQLAYEFTKLEQEVDAISKCVNDESAAPTPYGKVRIRIALEVSRAKTYVVCQGLHLPQEYDRKWVPTHMFTRQGEQFWNTDWSWPWGAPLEGR